MKQGAGEETKTGGHSRKMVELGIRERGKAGVRGWGKIG